MRTILREAIAARGSSLGDNQYVDLSGDGGSFQEHHRVYGREGRAVHGLRAAGRAGEVVGALDLLVPDVPGLRSAG